MLTRFFEQPLTMALDLREVASGGRAVTFSTKASAPGSSGIPLPSPFRNSHTQNYNKEMLFLNETCLLNS